jgi:hypothetical protein
VADVVAVADGNLTAAATWGLVDPTSKLVSTSISGVALTVAVQDSSTFIPGAVTIAGIVIRLYVRAVGSPTNTITCALRNTTAASTVATVTANVSDLPVSAAGNDTEGGWHYFRFSAPVLLVAGNSYAVRLNISATTTAVSIVTNSVATNWQRLLVTTTTQAPAAGDDIYIAQTFDGASNPAPVVSRSVTMDQTVATDYGSGVISILVAGFSISKDCTLAYTTTGGVNSILRLSCSLMVYSGGTLSIGSSGAEIPRNSTAVLEFDNAADGQFGLRVLNLGTFTAHGLSRSSGKDEWMALLTADEAVASTTIDIDTDTGWLNGDETVICSTSRTAGDTEIRALTANAGATSFTCAALTNAHLGSSDYFAEVFLLTRNVEVRSTSTTFMMYFNCMPTSIVSCSWMRWRYYSSSSGGGVWTINTITGTATFQFCVWRDGDQGISISGNAGGWSIDKSLMYVIGTSGSAFTINITTLAWTLTDFAIVSSAAGTINFLDISGTIGNLWQVSNLDGMTWGQIVLNDGTGGPIFPANTTWIAHSNGGGAATGMLQFSTSQQHITFPRFVFWRNNQGAPIEFQSGVHAVDIEFSGDFFANGITATEEPSCFLAARNNALADIRFVDCNISGDTLFQPNWGCLFDAFNIVGGNILWRNCKFSENTGTRRPLLVADIGIIPDLASGGMQLQGIADDCSFGAPESIKWYLASGPAPQLPSKYSYIICPRYNKVATDHRVYTPHGIFVRDTTTFDVTPSSQNIQPIGGVALAVDSNAFIRNTGFLVAVNSGAAVTPSVRVQIDASYNGSIMPQLVMLANRALGFNSDVVLDTHSGATGAFETLTGATGAAAADGVLEFVVRVYGTVGNAYVDTWSTSTAGEDTTGDRYWWGQPITNANTSSGGGGGGTPSSSAFMG